MPEVKHLAYALGFASVDRKVNLQVGAAIRDALSAMPYTPAGQAEILGHFYNGQQDARRAAALRGE